MRSCFQYARIIQKLNFPAKFKVPIQYFCKSCMCSCLNKLMFAEYLLTVISGVHDTEYRCVLWCQIPHKAWGTRIFSRRLRKCKLQNWILCFLFTLFYHVRYFLSVLELIHFLVLELIFYMVAQQYEPEIFPGLIYRMRQPKIVLLIFVSGKIVLTGAKVGTCFLSVFSITQ
jgi:hypothetical protein